MYVFGLHRVKKGHIIHMTLVRVNKNSNEKIYFSNLPNGVCWQAAGKVMSSKEKKKQMRDISTVCLQLPMKKLWSIKLRILI